MSALTAALIGGLVSAVWQGALLAALVWVCLRLVPGLSATARSVVWLSVFLLLVGLQVVPLMLTVPGAGHVSAVHLDPRWSVLVACLWAALSLGRAVQLVMGVAHVRRLARRAVPMDAGAETLAGLDFGRGAQVCASEDVARPCVIGFFRPKILLPENLVQNLSGAELRQVLVHEMEHLRRADDWTNLVQKLALVVFPLNPALAWVERRLCAERELACDDRVLAMGSGRKAYALCLAHLAEFALTAKGFSLVLGAWERRPELVLRVERILRRDLAVMNRGAALTVTGGVLAASLCGALALTRSPQLVSFESAPLMAQGVAAPDLQRMSRELGAKPQLVKATLPMEPQKPFRLVKKHAAAPVVRLAELRKANAARDQVPGGDRLLMMTEWTDPVVTQRMILADLRLRQIQQAAAVPAIFVVATPNGWLIVQI